MSASAGVLVDRAAATPATAPAAIAVMNTIATNTPTSMRSIRSGPGKTVLHGGCHDLQPRARIATDEDSFANGRIHEQQPFRAGQAETLGQFRNRPRRLPEQQLDRCLGDHGLAGVARAGGGAARGDPAPGTWPRSGSPPGGREGQ